MKLDLTAIEALEKLWQDISQGPCFPLKTNNRFLTHRIDDSCGKAVVDALADERTIWLSEAVEFLVEMGNAAQGLLALAREALAARAWLKADDACIARDQEERESPVLLSWRQAGELRDKKWVAREAYRRLVEQHDAEGNNGLG